MMQKIIRPALAIAALIGSLIAANGVAAQSVPSPYTSATRYDAAGRVAGTIAPDPDGAGSLHHLATRITYDASGRPIKKESGELSSWQSEAVLPANWTGFTVVQSVETTYDVMDRKVTETVKGSNGVAVSLTQYSYDAAGRLECTAVRMNPAVYASLPGSACTLGTQGSAGPDRITRNVYDAAGQLLQVRKAVGTAIEQAYATYSYTANGKQEYVIDANGNRAKLKYDGFDRQVKWIFPAQALPAAFNPATPSSALSSAGSLNTADYEQYGYDANGNRTSLRKRDGSMITYQYDNLNRNTVKVVPERAGLDPANTRDVYFGYDLRGLQTYARFDSASGEGVTNSYDGFGRFVSAMASIGGTNRTLTYQYDLEGNRQRVTHPDGVNFYQTYDGLNRAQYLYYYNVADPNNGAQLQTTAYNADGTRANDARWANTLDYAYDAMQRLSQKRLLQSPSTGGVETVKWNYTFNPASQLASVARTNDAFAFTGNVNVSRTYAANGLNQYTSAGPASFCYDANGNLTADGTSVYLYDIENRLVEKRSQANSTCSALAYTGSLQASLRYDPAGRLTQVQNGAGSTVRFLFDGDALVAEYDGAGTLLRRYAHGADAGADDPLFWFEGSSTNWSSQRQLVPNHQGSIVAVGLNDGTNLADNRYDEWGIPQSTNQGRFQYTGQAWIPELGMYYYKARIYSPTLGRFMQTDPIGYKDQVNLYAYVANDPLNHADPTGTSCTITPQKDGGSAVSCKIDDAKSFYDAGYSKAQVQSLAKNYANAVARSLEAGDKKITVSVNGRSFQTTGNQIASGLAKSYVSLAPSNGERASLVGGPLTNGSDLRSVLNRANPMNLPYRLNVGRNMFYDTPRDGLTLDRQQSRTFVHEGIHSTPGEAVMRGMPGFNDLHQDEYSSEASGILGGR